MAAKKFLGLGFTFAASDKGLEKKLKSISGLVSKINEGLGDIGSNAGKSSKSFRKMRGPAGEKQWQSHSKTERASRPKSSAVMEKISDDKLKGLVDAFSEKFSDSKVRGAFAQDATLAAKNMRDSGSKMQEIRDSLGKMAKQYLVAEEKSEKMVKIIKTVFSYAKQWASDVMNSFGNFLRTIGIDMQAIIPKEIRALGGLIGSLLRPIKDGFMALANFSADKILGLFRGSKSDKVLADIRKQNKLLTKTSKVMTDNIGGSSNSTIHDVLSDIMNETKEKKTGFFGKIFDKLKGWILPLAAGFASLYARSKLLKGAVGLLTKSLNLLTAPFRFIAKAARWVGAAIVSLIKSPIKTLSAAIRFLGSGISKFVIKPFQSMMGIAKMIGRGLLRFIFNPIRTIGSMLTSFGGWVARIGSLFGNMGSILSNFSGAFMNVARFFLKWVAPLAVIGTALAGFAQSLWGYKEEIVGFFKEYFALGESLRKYIFASFKDALAPVAGFLSGKFESLMDVIGGPLKSAGDVLMSGVKLLAKPFEMLTEGIMKVLGAIYDGWKLIGSLVGEGFSFGKNLLKGFRLEIDEKTNEKNRSAAKGFASAHEAAVGAPDRSYKDLVQMNEVNRRSNDLQGEQNRLLSEQNELLKMMVEGQAKNGARGVEVTVRGGRGLDIATRGAEAKTAALRGAR